MPAPFQHDDQVHLTDVDVTRRVVARSLCPHDLTLIGRNARLDTWMWSHRMRDISINDIAYGSDVWIEPGLLGSFFVVLIPLAGTSMIRCGRQEVQTRPGIASVPNPRQSLRMRWSGDCAQRVVRIEQPAIEAHLRDMLGYPLTQPLEFALDMDLAAGEARMFAEDIDIVVRRLDRNKSTYGSRYVLTQAEQILMTRLLLGAHHNYRDQLAADQPPAPGRAVRATVDVIEAHPEQDHTVGSLARAQGVSRRSLERAFREHTGTSPWKYVKTVRLRRAHDQLRATEPGMLTVGEVARRWGMTHSQFSAEYQRRYGETPLQTLRR
jgi:AraC-like DNA-binding protein